MNKVTILYLNFAGSLNTHEELISEPSASSRKIAIASYIAIAIWLIIMDYFEIAS